MKNTNFNSKKLKGRGFSSAPLMNNYNKSINTKEEQSGRTLLPICEADETLFLSAMYNKKYTSEKMTSRCPQSGRSMIEMLGVLAIIGVLSVGGIAGYSKAMMKYRTNKIIEQITLIAGNLRSFTASQPADRRYEGFEYNGNGKSGKDIIRKAKIVPDEMVFNEEQSTGSGRDSSFIVNAFGGAVYFYTQCAFHDSGEFQFGSSHCNAPSASITIVVRDIPPEACIDIMSHDWNALDILGMQINGYSHTNINIENAITQCNREYNQIEFAIQ